LSKRQERGIHVHWDNLATDCLPTKTLHHAFFNGWQAQRVGLLKEYIWDMLGKGLVYCCISDHDIERIFDEFHDRVKIDPWFAGAGE
jgi:glutamyl/glutaminyl-tRNA synthetase